jgi:hypothetical protein
MEEITGMLAVAGGLLIVLIPVAGLTARFALKPLIESISNAMRARQGIGDAPAMERRIAALEAEVTSLRSELRQVSDGAAFDRQLADSSSAPKLGA